MTPWGDIEIRRFLFRMGLFQRRGMSEARAEALADRLAFRDQDLDERRVCIECENLQASGRCFAAAQGWMKDASRRLEPVRDVLQRCGLFKWVKP